VNIFTHLLLNFRHIIILKSQSIILTYCKWFICLNCLKNTHGLPLPKHHFHIKASLTHNYSYISGNTSFSLVLLDFSFQEVEKPTSHKILIIKKLSTLCTFHLLPKLSSVKRNVTDICNALRRISIGSNCRLFVNAITDFITSQSERLEHLKPCRRHLISLR
jgi:hypothetical protein